KALEVCSSLSLEESLNYETVKSAILRACELVPEAYRQKFRGHKKNSTQTFVEFAREKGILFDKWCTASKVKDFDSMRELVLLEEFKSCLLECVVVYLNEQKTLNSAVAVPCEERIDDSYTPFIFKGLISLTGNSEDQKEIKMLRDMGAMQSFIVAEKLKFSEDNSCGSSVIVKGIEIGCVKVPLHRVHLQCELCTGFVRVAVRPSLPVTGVDFILGNDLAGGKVMPVLEVVDKPDIFCQSGDVTNSDVFPACAVTRAHRIKSFHLLHWSPYQPSVSRSNMWW
ncbi:hypothetical protein HF521_019815, partial [Silurus meridionalis]